MTIKSHGSFLHKVLGEGAGLAIGRGSANLGGVCYAKFRPDAPFTNDTDIMSPQGKDAGLRAAMHELGHALGLPHIGSLHRRGLGSSLMGKPDLKYKKENPKDYRVYLPEAAAAIIWKSLFSTAMLVERNGTTYPKYTSTNVVFRMIVDQTKSLFRERSDRT